MKPMCRLCGSAHFAREPHEFKKEVAEPSEVCRPSINKGAINAKAAPINKVVHGGAATGSLRDSGIGPEKVGNGRTRAAYNEYMREYMKKRRAKTASGVSA